MESYENYENITIEADGEIEGCNCNDCIFSNATAATFIGCNFENCTFETISTFVSCNLLDCVTVVGSTFESTNVDFSEDEISDSEALDIITGGAQ